MLLFEDFEVDKLESYLTELHIKSVEQIIAELQAKNLLPLVALSDQTVQPVYHP